MNITFDEEIVKELIAFKQQLENRCLYETLKWFTQLISSLKMDLKTASYIKDEDFLNSSSFHLAKTYYNLKEYDRASNTLSKFNNKLESFLYFYSKFQSCNFKSGPSFLGIVEHNIDDELYLLYKELCTLENIDEFHLYLLGIIAIKLDLKQEAQNIFIKSILKQPLLWPSWFELINLVPSSEEVFNFENLPKHWMAYFFGAKLMVRDMKYESALTTYQIIQNSGFKEFIYIKNEIANIYYLMKDMDESLLHFKDIMKIDPFCLEYVDTFSNLLYTLEKEDELSDLAHRCQDIDPFRPETCCVTGNYYSMKGEREKAISYFQKALTLNPDYYSAWILIGLEYNHLKNTVAALYANHRALKINDKDYRIWFGFGLTFELMNMPNYALYYYKKAFAFNSTDFRILMALGKTYENLGKMQDAKDFYSRAVINDYTEIEAIYKLAKVCESIDIPTAVISYVKYLENAQKKKETNPEHESHALLYIGHYYCSKEDYNRALYYFQKCLLYVDTMEEAKLLLKKAQDKLQI